MFNWFKIFNVLEFDATGLYSRSFTYNMPGVGQKTFLVTKGNVYGVTCDGVFLGVNMNDYNPNEMDGFAVYRDANNDVYWGIAVES